MPALLLLAGALSCVALPGVALPLVSIGAAAVAMVASVALIAPVPIEVSSHLRQLSMHGTTCNCNHDLHEDMHAPTVCKQQGTLDRPSVLIKHT